MNEVSPKVLTIVTPAYNAEQLIPVAIKSLRGQLNDDVEWIIVDDGSSDATLSVCNAMTADMPNVRIIHTENHGAGHARNVGIGKANGEWIAFLDSDDLYLPGAIMRILRCIKGIRDSDVDIVYATKTMTDMNQKRRRTYFPELWIKHCMPRMEFWTCLYRVSLLREHDIRFFEYQEQDVETAFRFMAFSHARRIKKKYCLSFYLQRMNPQSNTHTWNEYSLYYVKAKVYGELFQKSSIYCDYLCDIVISCVRRFLLLPPSAEQQARGEELKNLLIAMVNNERCSRESQAALADLINKMK